MSQQITVAIALWGAVLSTIGFGWQIWQWSQDRPSLVIEPPTTISVVVGADGKVSPLRESLRFVNRSPRAVTVYSVFSAVFTDWGTNTEWTTNRISATAVPIRIEDGAIAEWQKVSELEFSRLPALKDTIFSGTLFVRASTTVGVISASYPIEVLYGFGKGVGNGPNP